MSRINFTNLMLVCPERTINSIFVNFYFWIIFESKAYLVHEFFKLLDIQKCPVIRSTVIIIIWFTKRSKLFAHLLNPILFPDMKKKKNKDRNKQVSVNNEILWRLVDNSYQMKSRLVNRPFRSYLLPLRENESTYKVNENDFHLQVHFYTNQSHLLNE